ncbi:MAG TPA: RluA family pseudouridine synthase [bacterium]|nr:RluA family pseudouridine synthase [bacterium]
MAQHTLSILYEDNHVIAVNKQPSDIVQGDKTGDVTLADRVKEYIRETRGKTGEVFIGIPHRLDRPTSGVVLFARTSKSLERLSAAFRDGTVEKTYWAMVAEKPPAESGTLVHWLTRNPEQNKSHAAAAPRPGAREARLSYRLLLSLERYHLLEIRLETGRHHQIRAQLHAVGCHIKGDLKYGAPRSNPGGGIHLHARRLSFPHPVKKEIVTVVADPPRDALWDAALAQLHLRGD